MASQAQSIAATIPRCSTAARGTPACLTSTIAHVNTTHPRPELDVVSVLSKNLSPAVNWVPTKEQIADLLTKPLDKTRFLSLLTLLMTGSNEVP